MVCPICHKEFIRELASVSRRDNSLYICPDCGAREALDDIPAGTISEETKEEILSIISETNRWQSEKIKQRSLDVNEFTEKAARAIEESFSDEVKATTDIVDGLHEIAINNKGIKHVIYVDAFYEVYLKTKDWNKAINDIVEAVRRKIQ